MTRDHAGDERVIRIRRVGRDDDVIAGLVEVIVDCVDGGASIGFMHPFGPDRAEPYWADVLARADRGERIVLVAEDEADDRVLGTVQVVLSAPENQPHRSEITKMLVHRSARRRGVAEALMAAAEDAACSAGKTLLVLDTASDAANRLYFRRGWQRVGVIPGYALWPDGSPVDTTVYYKELKPPPPD